MELNEIKKELYKQKPEAVFDKASNVLLTYYVNIIYNEGLYKLYFLIPIKDIGDAIFKTFMPAQQLIRWLVIPETEK